MLERQGLGVAQGDGAVLLGREVAQVQAVAVVRVLLQHDRGVTLGQGFLVAGLGLFFLDDGAGEVLVAQQNLHAEQRSTPGQREAVNHFDMLVVGIAEPLLDTGLEHEAAQLARERHAQQGNILAVLRLQTRSVTRVHGLAFLCRLGGEWARSARR